MKVTSHWLLALGLIAAIGIVGCGGSTDKTSPSKNNKDNKDHKDHDKGSAKVDTVKPDEAAELAAERAKLSPEDRALVEAQEWCVVTTDERLGSMGPPIKVMIKDQPVFLCCKGCKKKAEADPDKTIAKLEELKAKKKQQGG